MSAAAISTWSGVVSTMAIEREDRGVMQPDATRDPSDGDEPVLRVRVVTTADVREVHLSGEMDMTSRQLVARCCVDGDESNVIVDISELTFMDCGGYATIAGARIVLAGLGRTLTLVGAAGEPARLLVLIEPRRAGR